MSRRRVVRSLGVLLACALVVVGCSPEDPQAQLAEAFDRTLSDSFAYDFTIEADREALALFGADGSQLGQLLSGSRLTGRRAGDATEFRVVVLGFDVFQVRDLGGDTIYAQLGFGELLGLAGAGQSDPGEALVELLRASGAPDTTVTAVEAAFDGRWVGVEGEIDTEELGRVLGGVSPPPAQEPALGLSEVLGTDVRGFVDTYVAVDAVRDEDGQRTFDVSVAIRELLRRIATADPTDQVQDLEADLAQLPETVPGTVITRDGLVTRLVVDLADLAEAGGEQLPGSIELQLAFEDHGEVDELTVPEDVVTITGDELVTAVGALSELVEELAASGLGGAAPPVSDPSPSASPSPAASPTPS